MGSRSETVCVTGAAGFIGSWLVMRLLQRGYTVRATVRDPGNTKKVKNLLELPHANTNLSLWKADLADKGSYDEAIKGCTGVFHVATPVNFESEDPENEMIKPAINGVLDIMKACLKAKSVRRLVFTSSVVTIEMSEHQNPLKDETCWTDVDFCRTVKMPGWMYYVSKTLAEKEAWKFAEAHSMDFVTIIPSLVVGPFIISTAPSSVMAALSPIFGNEEQYLVIQQGKFVHIDDVCSAHIFLYEQPKVEGRYICSSDHATIHDIVKLINKIYPDYKVPTKFKNIPDELEIMRFSSKKITDLGFQFKYNLEDMYISAIETCIEKGFLPKPTEKETA